ncbi:MAG TPA: transaldolase family protein, partial [Anaeromyxobacteraceae bacterium]|nr:transaldolase family protein [Anaeromyxobacteraceae bacterium]
AGLAARGALPQRVLFASTSVKDPRYPELMYVEALVGPGTVDTIPPATLAALRRGMDVRPTLEADLGLARAHLAALEARGISLDAVTDEVLAEGVRKFAEPFRRLLATIDDRRAHLSPPPAS